MTLQASRRWGFGRHDHDDVASGGGEAHGVETHAGAGIDDDGVEAVVHGVDGVEEGPAAAVVEAGEVALAGGTREQPHVLGTSMSTSSTSASPVTARRPERRRHAHDDVHVGEAKVGVHGQGAQPVSAERDGEVHRDIVLPMPPLPEVTAMTVGATAASRR